MNTLLLPVAGRSSRFPNMRPKWLLKMPDGKLMLEKSIELFPMKNFSRVVIVCLRDHIDRFLTPHLLDDILARIGHPRTEFCILDKPTSSQSETVAIALEKSRIFGSFYVKDCDNMFETYWNGGNEIAVIDLISIDSVNANNKSYVEVDPIGYVTKIVEKKIISNLFCCGGYGFKSSIDFLNHFRNIEIHQEVYLSNVIDSMLMSGASFQINRSGKYSDWGTAEDYRRYIDSFLS